MLYFLCQIKILSEENNPSGKICPSDQPVNLERSKLWSGFPSGSVLKNLPAMQEIWVRSLGWEDPLEGKMATHSSALTWRMTLTEEPGRVQPEESQSWTWLEQLSNAWKFWSDSVLLHIQGLGKEHTALLSFSSFSAGWPLSSMSFWWKIPAVILHWPAGFALYVGKGEECWDNRKEESRSHMKPCYNSVVIQSKSLKG